MKYLSKSVLCLQSLEPSTMGAENGEGFMFSRSLMVEESALYSFSGFVILVLSSLCMCSVLYSVVASL